MNEGAWESNGLDTNLSGYGNTGLSAEINAELGRLLEHLGEHDKSLLCYRQAMDLMERKLPDLPMPEMQS